MEEDLNVDRLNPDELGTDKGAIGSGTGDIMGINDSRGKSPWGILFSV